MSSLNRLPSLPALAARKLYKTGQSRGAGKNEIYQNRVLRNNTVLIPLEFWPQCQMPDDGSEGYEKGSIVLVEPDWYFTTNDADKEMAEQGLRLGANALLLFRRRSDWTSYGEGRNILADGRSFTVATSRTAPLGGVYFARIHQTTASGDLDLNNGYNVTSNRGAGIRVFEYASAATIEAVKLQLEALLWMCEGSVEDMVAAGMTEEDARIRRDFVLRAANDGALLDLTRLHDMRAIDGDGNTVCPLCKKPIRASNFLDRAEQAAGREIFDLTTTEVSLFHIQELRVGKLHHKPYNAGWGHHHCNVVVRDAGIIPTLVWMQEVLDNQGGSLYQEAKSVEEAVDL